MIAHDHVSGKLAAEDPLAVRPKVLPTPTDAPVAAGDCDEQTGGVFLITVHDFDVVLVPLL